MSESIPSSWDPLATEPDPGILIASQRREIRNILKSYTGYYDLFSELVQNSLDAVEKRFTEAESSYEPSIWMTINLSEKRVAITDNGCGMSAPEFRQFLRPNFSFKKGGDTRGNKGVGATYLAYGFNHLETATRFEDHDSSGVLKRGREWVEDASETVSRPKVEPFAPSHEPFKALTRGTSMVVRLDGPAIRPRDLSWLGAKDAETWLAVLRSTTPLGGVYLCDAKARKIKITLEVIDLGGNRTEATLDAPEYLHPALVMNRTADLREYLEDRKKRVDKSLDVSKPPAKFRALHGIWGEWKGDAILNGETPINVRLDKSEANLVKELGVSLRVFLAFSTDLWDTYNDKNLGIRKGHRLLRGGLQLCTRHMPQGQPITIPMTNNIGFQNLAHVLVHFENAEPDLGRKGFQPDVVRVAEKLSVSAVTAFRKHYPLLRKPGGAKAYDDELKLEEWKRKQEEHEKKFPLTISGAGLFLPTEELPIRSEPIVEQDVVALFNQMLSSGLVRGVQLISSSQYKQYDGLYRIAMSAPFDKYILAKNNPLGIDAEHFISKEKLETVVKVLEYKFSVDGLIEELQSEVKSVEDVDLVVAWEMGTKWLQMFDVISYLDEDNVHHRTIHGTTHSFTHSMTGSHAFEAMILKDIISFLTNPDEEQENQRKLYLGED